MGCVSSKILSKSGSFQEKVSHGFKGSNLIEEIILSNPKSNGDQFLALLRTSNSAASREKDAADQSTAMAAGAEPLVKIETITVAELLAGLEEEEEEEEERNGGEKSSAQRCVFDGAAGRPRSFRTVEEFDALVTQSSPPPELQDGTPAKQSSSSEQDEEARAAAAAAVCSADQDATGATRSEPSEQEEAAAAGNKRRARARQLGELKVPPAFDFSKSGSLRDWLLQGGQIFSPGSYITPKFGNSEAAPPQERGVHHAGEPRLQQQHSDSVFDPELVAQFEQAMERLSEDEERALEEILEAMGAAAEEEGTARLETSNDRPVMVQE
ncbi:hypothetical protein E2562_018162 [Oryza meyeriana var. granulata]|uniref:Uncharacterized protein n=1 Tax=Oryza meyeriana var. granulata TaxID=110450 RepID=A0A6G1C778_9ORYZ|nr:hypothetical protein E2562_018162 [Oryza meyeriana var. granulata]